MEESTEFQSHSDANTSSAVVTPGEESTDSDNEHYPSSSFHRKLSTNKDIKNTASLKEGYLMKQTSSFQRWHRRYFKVKGRALYYAKNDKAQIFDEISLTEVTLAENSSKLFAHTFQVITPFRTLVLAAENRSAMAEWMGAIQSASTASFHESGDHSNGLSGAGAHVWFSTTHAMPTYCNVCREQLCGMMSSGLSCEVCKFKSHKHCASKALNNCKWTTLASIGKENLQESEGSLIFPHQWLEGNLPVSAKCAVCEKTCGSVLKLQDWRCIWCRACVHTSCRFNMKKRCHLSRISVVPPTALHTVGNDEAWEPSLPLQGCSPLLVFVNSKSGDHQGLKFLRRFKQLLNPAQVFDLVNGGPRPGLQLFRHFEPFRILVCGGDGSVGWVMGEIDSLDMHRQVQVGVLPLGTGNDLARVLGWGASCDDEAHLPHLLDKYERATTKMLDRWSIMTYERGCVIKPPLTDIPHHDVKPEIAHYEDSVVSHLQNILQSNQHKAVISSAKVLCETVRDMIGKVGSSADDSEINLKCANLSQKLNSLLLTLNEETECDVSTDKEGDEILEIDSCQAVSECHSALEETREVSASIPVVVKAKPTKFQQKEILMSRANSLKKAVRQIIEHAERTIDEQSGSPPIMIVRPLSLTVQTSPDTVKSDSFSKLTSEHELCKESPEDVVSPIDPNVALPVPTPFADQHCQNSFILEKLCSPTIQSENDQNQVQIDQLLNTEKSSLEIIDGFPTIEVQSPSSSSNDKTPEAVEVKMIEIKDETPPSPKDLDHGNPFDNLNVPDGINYFYRGASPRASRRVSMGSLLKPLEVEIPNSPNSRKNSGGHYGESLSEYCGLSHSPFSASSTCASSISSSPNKCADSSGKKRTMPIINPLVLHPSWPSVAAGGVIGKVLMANADAMCAVASPLMDPEASEELMMQGFKERAVMNNYFGIGLDAKITLDFHLKREEHPEKCRSRAKNFMWYGVLGSKEMVQRTCKNLDQRVKLECDGVRIPLPRLQGIVICNIPSFMGGTNFWGMWKEDGFLHSTFDDGVVEVMAVFHTVQMATSRVVNFYQHRIAQCTSVTITILGDEPIPVQVDGEAWLQPPGVIHLVLKNRMPMLCRNRKLESNLKTWEEKLKAMSAASGSFEHDDGKECNKEKKRHSRGSLFGMRFNRKDKREDSVVDGTWDGFSDEAGSSEVKGVETWSAGEVSEWLENIHLGEYKSNFLRHDIRGAELLCLQRRDLKELGVTKIGHLKRILQAIENLHKDSKESSA